MTHGRTWVCWLAWAVSMPVIHAADWIKVSTSNFELYTSSRESEAREILENFEQTRDFFMRVKPTAQTSELPLTLVVFDSARDYKQYSEKSFTPAYFVGDEQRDYIVMSDLGEDRDLAATHEYVHVLVRHSGLTLPVWLNEGMADVYSTMKVAGGKIVVGTSPKGRTFSLINDKWIPLPNLLAADHTSPLYNEANRAGAFYAQSWLLAHMLMLSEEYGGKFPAFVARLSTTGSAQAAFSDVYGKSVAQVQTAMNTYFRQPSIGAAGYRATLHSSEIGPARAATELERDVTLAKLTAFAGRPADALTKLEQLAAAHPENPELDETMAYVAFRGGDRAAALRHFQAAFTRGTSNWKTYWDYARLLLVEDTDRRGRLQALRKALEGNPALHDARLMLGMELFTGGEFEGALAEFQRIQGVDTNKQGAVFAAMAFAAAKLERDAEARSYLTEARKHPLNAVQKTGMDEIEQLLARNTPSPDATVQDADEVPSRPVLRRTAPPKPARR